LLLQQDAKSDTDTHAKTQQTGKLRNVKNLYVKYIDNALI
jgi:hypothetical protein